MVCFILCDSSQKLAFGLDHSAISGSRDLAPRRKTNRKNGIDPKSGQQRRAFVRAQASQVSPGESLAAAGSRNSRVRLAHRGLASIESVGAHVTKSEPITM